MVIRHVQDRPAQRVGLSPVPDATQLRERAEFLNALRNHVRGAEQEQRGARRLVEKRLGLDVIITAVEQVKVGEMR